MIRMMLELIPGTWYVLIPTERLPHRCNLGFLIWLSSASEPIIMAYTSVRAVTHASPQCMQARYSREWLGDKKKTESRTSKGRSYRRKKTSRFATFEHDKISRLLTFHSFLTKIADTSRFMSCFVILSNCKKSNISNPAVFAGGTNSRRWGRAGPSRRRRAQPSPGPVGDIFKITSPSPNRSGRFQSLSLIHI